MKKFLLFLLVFTSFLYGQKLVTVSLIPQKYFVEKITKDKFKVNVMVKPGFSPATYEPKTSQMRELANSSAYFSIGVPFENTWLERFKDSNKNMMIVDTTKGIQKIAMAEHKHHEDEKEHHDDHGHDKHEDEKDHHDEHGHDKHEDEKDHHSHKGLDPHVWLDPILVKIQAKNILDAVIKIDNENKDFYTKNYMEFLNELDILHKKLENNLKNVQGKKFMVFHPSWGYFAKRYGLIQEAVEKEGKDPKPKELMELIKEAKEESIKIVFVAPQFSQKSANIIAQSIKGRVSVIDPLNKNWDESLINTAKEIIKSYQ